MLISKEVKARHLWREYLENRKKLMTTVFHMVAHPDASGEQLAQVRHMAIDAQTKHKELKAALQAKFPTTDWGRLDT